MAVGGQPNDVYLAETLLAEFKAIGGGEGHYTRDVHAEMPSFHLSDGNPNAFVINPEVLAVETPALLLWVDSSVPIEGKIGMAERDLVVVICGVVKQDVGLQQAVLRLAADLRSVMLFNQQRTFPGATTSPDHGATTRELPGGINLNMSRNNTGNTIGYFVSFWAVSHKFPHPHG